jgi:uncharacterized integral membrane protein
MKEFWTTLSTWKKLKLILSIILIIYVFIFALINLQETEINFIFFQVKISITLLIFISIVAGYLSSNIFDYKKHRSKNNEIKMLKNKVEELEK